MRFKIILLGSLLAVVFISGCSQDNRVEQEQDQVMEELISEITPDLLSSESYYRTLLPYVKNLSKGTTVSANTRLDLNNQELGLLELAQTFFPTSNYLFTEGQYITKDEAEKWLGRYDAEKNRLGLNPESGSNELIHILEHDYIRMSDQSLGGIALSLSISTIMKSEDNKDIRLSTDEVRAKVESYASRIIERLRTKGIEVPILIAGYALEPSTSILPGNYINLGFVEQGNSVVSKWNVINERHVVYPGRNASTDSEKEFSAIFNQFQEEIQSFFPQYSSVTATVRFLSDEPREIWITVRASYSSRTEVIAFTQYVSGRIAEYFPENIKISVYIESANKSEALYIRPVEGDPIFHIYR